MLGDPSVPLLPAPLPEIFNFTAWIGIGVVVISACVGLLYVVLLLRSTLTTTTITNMPATKERLHLHHRLRTCATWMIAGIIWAAIVFSINNHVVLLYTLTSITAVGLIITLAALIFRIRGIRSFNGVHLTRVISWSFLCALLAFVCAILATILPS